MICRSLLSAAIVLTIGCSIGGSLVWAQKVKGKTQPAQTKYLMRGITQPNCAGLGKLLKEGASDDKSWDTAACHASILNEMSYVLMADGRCPDADWAGAAKELRTGSAAVLAAVEKKDSAAASDAFNQVTASCASCHKTHKTAK